MRQSGEFMDQNNIFPGNCAGILILYRPESCARWPLWEMYNVHKEHLFGH
jgi:hypothetical protein